jgi:hypothetical protein
MRQGYFLYQLDPTLLYKFGGHFFVHWHFRVKHDESIKLFPGFDFMALSTSRSRGW